MSRASDVRPSRAVFFADLPSRKTLLLFGVVGLLCLALLVWWVLFGLEQTAQMVEARRDALLAQRYEASQKLFGRGDLQPGPAPGFPGLELRPAGSVAESPDRTGVPLGQLEIAVRAEQLEELKAWQWRKLVMFVSEGGFFISLLLAGLGLIFLTLRHEVALHRQQSNFVAAVTHELKSPLASLRLYLDTILMGRAKEPAAQQRCAETMSADVDRLEGLIENLLDAARAEDRGGLRLDLEETNVSDLIAYWLEELRPSLERRQAVLDEKVETGLVAKVDSQTMRAVVRNLLDNAVKYGGSSPKVELRLRSVDREVAIDVQDNGIGLERHELGRIFERFYRVGDEMVRSIRGTGLGLYLVREIVKAHGGRVWAESAGRGQGTTVCVRLPRIESGDAGLKH